MIALLTTYFNPANYQIHIDKFNRFKTALEAQTTLTLYIGEVAFKDVPFHFTAAPNIQQFRTDTILWQKERIFNLMVQSLPPEVDKIIILDDDILFDNSLWITEMDKALDNYVIVQGFEKAIFLSGGNTKFIERFPEYGFAYAIEEYPNAFLYPRIDLVERFHPGFVWGFQRKFFTDCGLPDKLILGGGDLVLALSIINVLSSVTKPIQVKFPSQKFQEYLIEQNNKIFQIVDGKIGYIKGNISHIYHGSVQNRQYINRWKLLGDYNPNDLIPNFDGLYKWNTDNPSVSKVSIEQFFIKRLEDTIISTA